MNRFTKALAVAWAVPTGIWTCSARADYLHFSSLDMTPVRISLVHKVAGKADFPDLVVPRAYIYFVDGFLPGQGSLPSQLSSNDVKLMFVDGTGEAWTVAVAARAQRDGIDATTARHRMRTEETTVEISPSTTPTAAYAEVTRAGVTGPAPMSIAEGVVAHVSFVDFRLFGGRAYANRRLRFVREVSCRYLTHC